MSFDRILGQESAILGLKQLLASGNLPPAFLFFGPSGVGKTSAALEFGKALNCEPTAGRKSGAFAQNPCDSCPSCAQANAGIDVDLKHLDAAYQAGLLDEDIEKQTRIKIDTIRYVVKDLEMRSMLGRWKTAVVEDAHLMMAEAQNALLKALEEPPPRTLWILVTDQREMLLPTARSRCQAIAFRPLPSPIVSRILNEKSVPREEAKNLIPLCEGSPGRALKLWQRHLPAPATWLGDSLAPFRMAEQLPRELHLARPLVEDHLRQMMWHLRLGDRGIDHRSRRGFQDLEDLRRALRSNADPRLILELAAFSLQALQTS